MSRLVEILTRARKGIAHDTWNSLEDSELPCYARLYAEDLCLAIYPIDPIVFEGQTYTVEDAFIIKPDGHGRMRLEQIDRARQAAGK